MNHSKIEEALKLGADIHTQLDDALHWAAINDHRDTVEYLLSRGADIHAYDDRVLHMAVKSGNTETVELLLDRGADIHARNDRSIRSSTKLKHKETTLLLLRHGADPKVQDADGIDAFKDTNLAKWLVELKSEILEHFKSDKPSQEQCFTAGKLRDEVLTS